MQISKNGLVLHLSKNQRFNVGVIVFIETKGIETLRDGLLKNNNADDIPEIMVSSLMIDDC